MVSRCTKRNHAVFVVSNVQFGYHFRVQHVILTGEQATFAFVTMRNETDAAALLQQSKKIKIGNSWPEFEYSKNPTGGGKRQLFLGGLMWNTADSEQWNNKMNEKEQNRIKEKNVEEALRDSGPVESIRVFTRKQ